MMCTMILAQHMASPPPRPPNDAASDPSLTVRRVAMGLAASGGGIFARLPKARARPTTVPSVTADKKERSDL